jgi:hypothetical protein
MSRMRVVADPADATTRDRRIQGMSLRWPVIVEDERALPFVAGGATLLALTVAIAVARLLEEDFSTFVLVCAVVGAAVGVVRPFYAVLGAIIVSPTFAWVVFGPDVSAFQVLVAGAAVGCLRDLWRHPFLLRRLLTRPEVVLAVLFVTWLVLAALARRDVSDWGFVRNYAGAVVFLGVLALTLRTARRSAIAVGALLVGILATALVGLAQIVTTDALVSAWVLPDVRVIQETYTRLGSSWGLASVGSDFGKDVLVGFLVAVPLALASLRRPLRISLVAVSLVLAAALAMSGGRSAWLGGVVGLAYIALVWRRWHVAAVAGALAAGLAALLVNPSAPIEIQTAVGLAPQSLRAGPPVEERGEGGPGGGSPSPRLVVGGVRDGLSTEMSSNLRRRLTRAGFEMVRDEPLFGVGAGAFKHYVDRYEPLPAGQERPIDARPNLSAHNVVLELWADSGTAAAVLYVLFLALVLLRLEQFRRRGPGAALLTGLSAALIGLFVTSLFHNYEYDNLLWVICGLAVGLALWRNEAPAAPSPEHLA